MSIPYLKLSKNGFASLSLLKEYASLNLEKAVKTAEATIQGTSVFEYDKNGTVAKAYENLAKEVLQDERFKEKNEPCFTR